MSAEGRLPRAPARRRRPPRQALAPVPAPLADAASRTGRSSRATTTTGPFNRSAAINRAAARRRGRRGTSRSSSTPTSWSAARQVSSRGRAAAAGPRDLGAPALAGALGGRGRSASSPTAGTSGPSSRTSTSTSWSSARTRSRGRAASPSRARSFEDMGGFDERFVGWGFEDGAWPLASGLTCDRSPSSPATSVPAEVQRPADVYQPLPRAFGRAHRRGPARHDGHAASTTATPASAGATWSPLRRDHGLHDRVELPASAEELARDIANLRRDDAKVAAASRGPTASRSRLVADARGTPGRGEGARRAPADASRSSSTPGGDAPRTGRSAADTCALARVARPARHGPDRPAGHLLRLGRRRRARARRDRAPSTASTSRARATTATPGRCSACGRTSPARARAATSSRPRTTSSTSAGRSAALVGRSSTRTRTSPRSRSCATPATSRERPGRHPRLAAEPFTPGISTGTASSTASFFTANPQPLPALADRHAVADRPVERAPVRRRPVPRPVGRVGVLGRRHPADPPHRRSPGRDGLLACWMRSASNSISWTISLPSGARSRRRSAAGSSSTRRSSDMPRASASRPPRRAWTCGCRPGLTRRGGRSWRPTATSRRAPPGLRRLRVHRARDRPGVPRPCAGQRLLPRRDRPPRQLAVPDAQRVQRGALASRISPHRGRGRRVPHARRPPRSQARTGAGHRAGVALALPRRPRDRARDRPLRLGHPRAREAVHRAGTRPPADHGRPRTLVRPPAHRASPRLRRRLPARRPADL